MSDSVKRRQGFHELTVEQVCDVQTQAVDVELFDPAADAGKDVIHDRGISEVELDQFVMPLPALVPEAVMILGIPVKAQVEPVPVWTVPFFLLYLLKRPEAPSHMVEHPGPASPGMPA